ncbi:sensor histidine kinase [Cryptosporangium minutisporangium]|uniref:Sensor-like histidine kinase SenX3 n=1 Tax=Cryptosporangium minutisporangium TaxID=113569 RepID=A0ABP6SQ26_9ACTN
MGDRARLADPARLRALAATGLSTTTAVPALDRLTALANRTLGTPIALVSLVAVDNQFFPSASGLTGATAAERRAPLSHSFCKHVVLDQAPFLVTDARADNRVRNNPSVTRGGIAAYAGFPLRSPDGHVLGAFCVADRRVRSWTENEVATLGDLTTAVESEIALRQANAELRLSAQRIRTVLDTALDAFVSIDAGGRVTAWNAAAEHLFGRTAAEALGADLTGLIVPERLRSSHEAGLARVRASGTSQLAGRRLELLAVDRTGHEFPVEMTLQVSEEVDGLRFHAFIRDITDRTAAHEALERERQRLTEEQSFLQALLDSLDTGVVACDQTGRLALFSQALLRMLGSSVQPLDAQTWSETYDLFGPDGRTPLTDAETPLARAFAGELVEGQELMIAAPGLAPRRFVANGRPIDPVGGRRIGAVVALHDVTDAYRAEKLRGIQHAVAQALSEATSAHEAAAAAIAAVAEGLGWPYGEYREVTEADDGTQVLSRVSRWAAGAVPSAFPYSASVLRAGQDLAGQAWRRSTTIVAGPAASLPCAVARIALPVSSGSTVLGVITFASDTAEPPHPDTLAMLEGVCDHVGRYLERRRAEDLALALAAARRELDRIIEQINDYVWTVEVCADGTIRSIYTSPNGTGVFGDALPTDLDLGGLMAARIHPDDRSLFLDFHTSIRAGRSAEVECRVVGFDGLTRWIWTRGVTRWEDGRLFVDGICTNVTERRELTERREELFAAERQQVARLRELDGLKDELVAVVSHELRNPISAIRGYTEILLDDPALAAEHRGHAEVIERKSAQLLQIINDLLDLARLDAGHIDLRRTSLSTSRLLSDALADHWPAAVAKNLTVVTDTPGDLLLYGDPARLRQVLDNLLSNAIKYTPDGGQVTVTAVGERGGVEVRVSDTGIGIPAEQLAQLFTRFFRARTAVEHGIRGTGLGLAVTKAIVEAHAGTVTAEPGPETGTTFRVWLPGLSASALLAEPAAEPLAEPAAATAGVPAASG